MTVALKPPTEREALADQAAAQQWVRDWQAEPMPAGASIEWQERSWSRIGRQRVPVRLALPTADAVAAFVGGAHARRWRTATARVAAVRDGLTQSAETDAALRRHAGLLLVGEEQRFLQVLEVARWLARNDVSGLRPRQIPVRGVDSKWFAAHRSALTALLAPRSLGIVDADPVARVRVLDANLLPTGPYDFSAPAAELAALDLSPDVVIVLENLETVLAMPSRSRAVVVHGAGYAVDVVTALPWVQRSPILYWGDLDSHGFAILHRLRTHHPDVRSVLMDETTLLAHRDLWVPEPSPTRGSFPSLTAPESATLQRLRAEGDVRLEQERIPWASALQAVEREGVSAPLS